MPVDPYVCMCCELEVQTAEPQSPAVVESDLPFLSDRRLQEQLRRIKRNQEKPHAPPPPKKPKKKKETAVLLKVRQNAPFHQVQDRVPGLNRSFSCRQR